MSLKPEQYIALSAAAYGDYSDDDKNQKIDRIRNKMQNNKLECSELDSLSDYTLIDFTSTSSGFRVAAFQNPKTSEIVFSSKSNNLMCWCTHDLRIRQGLWILVGICLSLR